MEACNNFKCVNLVDGECEEMGGECISGMCEDWGECLNCQKQDSASDCWKPSGR